MVRPIPFAIALAGVVLTSVVVRSDDPVSSSVTFNREIVRIFQRKCLQCHGSGSVAMSLGTYRDARPWSRAIREELVEQRMPPWGAAPGYTAIANDAGLTAREMAMILTWVDGGLPKGEDRDLPRDAGKHHAPAADPDRRLELPVQRIPADEEYVQRRLIVDTGTSEPSRVRRVEIVPGNRRVLRAAVVSMVAPGASERARWVGGWTPWQNTLEAPETSAFLMPAGARLMIDLHYRGRDVEMEDRSSVSIAFDRDGTGTGVADEIDVKMIGDRGTSTLPRATRIWAIVPQLSTEKPPYNAPVERNARAPDGTVKVLLWIPKYEHQWPTPFLLRDAVDLSAGTTVSVTVRGIQPSRAQPSLVKLLTNR